MLAVIDLKIGNTGSLMRALELVGLHAQPTADPAGIAGANAIILPGVGAFGAAMQRLYENGLVAPLRRAAAAGTPIFGICLGMQLLATESEEHGHHDGLGLIPGRVRRLIPDHPGVRVPNVGWADVTPSRPGALFDGDGGCFYHVHSYQFVPDDPTAIAATIDYGQQRVCVAVERDVVCGVQFHPEKSQDDGLGLLARYAARLRRENRL